MDLRIRRQILGIIVVGFGIYRVDMISCWRHIAILNIFLLEVNFDKYTIGLYLLLISSMLAKFIEN